VQGAYFALTALAGGARIILSLVGTGGFLTGILSGLFDPPEADDGGLTIEAPLSDAGCVGVACATAQVLCHDAMDNSAALAASMRNLFGLFIRSPFCLAFVSTTCGRSRTSQKPAGRSACEARVRRRFRRFRL
jgi:hypothetical protein